jgi:hypothetical protein
MSKKSELIKSRQNSAKMRNSRIQLKSIDIRSRKQSADLEVRMSYEQSERKNKYILKKEYNEISAMVKHYREAKKRDNLKVT